MIQALTPWSSHIVDNDPFQAPRKLTHEQARMEQLLYWSKKTIPERLAAMTALNQRLYRMRGIEIDEQIADFTPRRVPRRPR
jgi:hypothetical protein